ncbi:MAG: carbamoyl phosphate synthase small subunit [Oscillospiraceae bacterium]|nr:carbamoyl phosphate synthase small subunit [Oscillospiraceae bacterium]
MKARIELTGGQVFEGAALCGRPGGFTADIVFNTSMTGITEILTDPASLGQALVLTYPMIGNSGVSFEDFQSDAPQVAALIVSELSELESNFRSDDSLKAVLERSGIPIIAGVDTRSVVRLLRGSGGHGPARAAVTVGDGGLTAQAVPVQPRYQGKRRSVTADKPVATLAVLDTGLRSGLAAAFAARGVSLEVFPYGSAPEGAFDGYLLPSGPGDPAGYDLAPVRDVLQTGKPVFAEGLGHQLLALAHGAKTYPLSPGHRGANIPVYSHKTNLSVITLQNHGYAVDADSVAKDKISHVNVNDGSVEGLCWREDILSVQFQPDAEVIAEFISYL